MKGLTFILMFIIAIVLMYEIEVSAESIVANENTNEFPENVIRSEPHSIFYPGLYGANAYRIPALYYTMDGTLIAGIDKRLDSDKDAPADIDMLIRRSFDEGDTWDDG